MIISTKQFSLPISWSYNHIPTYFVLCGVARDDDCHDFQSLGAAAQAVDVGDVGTLLIHRLHKLWHDENSQCVKYCISLYFMLIIKRGDEHCISVLWLYYPLLDEIFICEGVSLLQWILISVDIQVDLRRPPGSMLNYSWEILLSLVFGETTEDFLWNSISQWTFRGLCAGILTATISE